MQTESLIEKIKSLPPERINEVEDFVDFIAQRNAVAPPLRPLRSRARSSPCSLRYAPRWGAGAHVESFPCCLSYSLHSSFFIVALAARIVA